MEREVQVNVLGNTLLLVNDADEYTPVEVFRLGSVPIAFTNVDSGLIRVFGFLENLEHREQRVEFEKVLRRMCECPQLLSKLFGHEPTKAKAKRFNPSKHLNQLGWRSKAFGKEMARKVTN